jgi:hypothetical protein
MEPADTCGVNIRKRVNEILAEASGCLSAAKEKARPQDFMITTYDVLSPEETPQPGKHTLFRFYESGTEPLRHVSILFRFLHRLSELLHSWQIFLFFHPFFN